MSRVLIVDEQVTGRMLLEKLSSLLEEMTWIGAFAHPADALKSAAQEPPDLVLADCTTPDMDGVGFIRQLRSLPGCTDVPLVVVAPADDRQSLSSAFDAGATDFLGKPVDPYQFRARCRNMLTMRQQQKLLRSRTHVLAQKVQEATAEIRTREHDTLLRLAKAGEYRDEDTGNHVLRMSQYTRIIAEQLGLSDETCATLELASGMHDIGKIGISDTILLQPRRLEPEEFNTLKTHTTIGYEILRGSPSKYLQTGAIIALAHHEKYDGSGYPGGLRGAEIPKEARVVAVADVYDALTSARPYKDPWPTSEALRWVESQVGQQFDPDCVRAFRAGFDRVLEVHRRLSDDLAQRRPARFS